MKISIKALSLPIAEKIKQKFAFIDYLYTAFNRLDSNRKWLIIGSGGGLIMLLIAILLLINHQDSAVSTLALNENKRTSVVMRELNDINNQLQTLSSSPQNSEDFKTAISTINTDLADIHKSISEVAKAADVQRVSSQISSMKDDVDSQMLDLKRAVANSQDAKQYLDPKVLPFHVISIDVISQQPFVSINYASHVTPFAVGDAVAGWQITAADYDAAQVVFKNDRDQYVKVSLLG